MTPKQEAFVREYLVDLNATQATIRAGYSARTAGSVGFDLLRKPEISSAIAAAQQARAQRTEITADRVLRELARIAFMDPRKLLAEDGTPIPVQDLDDDTAAGVVGLDVLEEWGGAGEDRVQLGVTKKVKLADKVAALGLAMRHLGMLQTKVELNGNVTAAVEYVANMPKRGE